MFPEVGTSFEPHSQELRKALTQATSDLLIRLNFNPFGMRIYGAVALVMKTLCIAHLQKNKQQLLCNAHIRKTGGGETTSEGNAAARDSQKQTREGYCAR
jgi:hypothetical protein